MIEKIRRKVNNCKFCGSEYGNSACGFGREENPLVFFIGMNPWVKDHEFADGRGITILKKRLKLWNFDDFFFDNVIKCQMPENIKVNSNHANNCIFYLQKQLHLIGPKNLIIFGRFAAESLGIEYNKWMKIEWDKYNVYTVPHFSSPLYPGDESIQSYYIKLKNIIDEILSVKKKPKVLGMTCGIGSMLIGARNVGFDVVGNIEWRSYYHTGTFEHNFPDAFMVKKLDELTEKQIENIDLIMGHPECGSYSILNRSRHKTEKNPGDIPIFIDAIKRIKPKFFVMDNLPRSLIGYSINEWAEKLTEYNLFPEWISNYNYGNIQKNRNRFFMVGVLKSENFIFKPGEEENTSVLKDHLQDCDGLKNHNEHTLDGFTSRSRLNLSNKKCGEKIDPKEILEKVTWEDFRKYFKNRPEGHVMSYVNKAGIASRRIGTSMGYWNGHSHLLDGTSLSVHPRKNLPFTLRERARIQGCPDDFIFRGEKLPWNHEKNSKMIKQTGKFMPVQFCEYISKQIIYFLQQEKFECSGRRLIKSSKYVDEAKKWYCENVGYSDQKNVCELCWIENCNIFQDGSNDKN